MSGQIFISYRREDGSAWAGRMYDRLHSRFPSEKIFMDVDSLAPGVDFVEALEESVGACDVLIAVISRARRTRKVTVDSTSRRISFASLRSLCLGFGP